MNPTNIADQINYPESDGRPMGETDTHRRWMIRIFDLLEYRYRNQQVYLASDLLVYYEPGQPTRFIVPDVFVVLDCQPGDRRVFKTWEEKRVPNVVFEVTSRGTSSQDIVDKPKIYEQMGVQEYFLYDPTAEYLRPALQGYRLVDGVLTEIELVNGFLRSETLGIELRLNEKKLEMFDSESNEPLLSEAGQERAARLAAETRAQQLQDELDRLRGGQSG